MMFLRPIEPSGPSMEFWATERDDTITVARKISGIPGSLATSSSILSLLTGNEWRSRLRKRKLNLTEGMAESVLTKPFTRIDNKGSGGCFPGDALEGTCAHCDGGKKTRLDIHARERFSRLSRNERCSSWGQLSARIWSNWPFNGRLGRQRAVSAAFQIWHILI